MLLGYSLKRKSYKKFNKRTKTIIKRENVKVYEKFGVKERIIDYDS